MRVALTGGRGFLGSRLAASLGDGVVLLDGDVRKPDTYLGVAGCDAIVHFAAQSNVPQSQRSPAETWDVNVNGTLALLERARASGFRGRIVLVSSAHVYGSPRKTPTDERQPVDPRTPYGASKAACEALGSAYRESYGLDIVAVRPFNVYGPGQAAGFLVPDIFNQLAAGPSLALGDPEPVRDFVHVDDAVRFFRAVLAKPTAPAKVLNLGSGQGHSIRAVAALAVRATGMDVTPAFQPSRRRAGETDAFVGDVQAAEHELGWRAEIGLEDGLRRTWASWPRPAA